MVGLRHTAALCLLAALLCQAGSRTLQQCTGSASSSATSTSQNAVSEAVSKAYAECNSCPCQAQADAAAQAIAYAVAEAIANVEVAVTGGAGCQGIDSGSADANSVASVAAKAYADAESKGCGGKTTASAQAVQQSFASAAASAKASVGASGGNAQEVATSIAKSIQPAIAKAMAGTLFQCKCSGGAAQASPSASLDAASPSPSPSQEAPAAASSPSATVQGSQQSEGKPSYGPDGRFHGAGTVNDTTFDELVLKSPIPVLVDFWAPWCGPCQTIAPLIDELAAEYSGKLRTLKLNTDESPAVANQYSISGIPTIMFFKNGQKVDEVSGSVSKATLERTIETYLD